MRKGRLNKNPAASDDEGSPSTKGETAVKVAVIGAAVTLVTTFITAIFAPVILQRIKESPRPTPTVVSETLRPGGTPPVNVNTLPPKETPTAVTSTPRPTPPPPPVIKSYSFTINECCGLENTQRSKPIDFTREFETVQALRVEFRMMETMCSNMRLHILLDGREVHTTDFFGPLNGILTTGMIELGPVSAGKHSLTLSPEGQVGGCNKGYLQGWGGSLAMYVSERQ